MKIIRIFSSLIMLLAAGPVILQAYNTNQAADVVIGQIDMTSSVSATTANNYGQSGPTGIYSDSSRLFVSDGWNNRILGYHTIPTTNNAAADFVIGPSNFTDRHGGGNIAPAGVYSDGTRLFVAEVNSNRVVIYNAIPTATGSSPNIAIGQPDMTSNGENQNGSVNANTLDWPNDVYSDGTRVFIADSTNNRVLIYNTIPTTNDAVADVVIGQPNMTSNANNGASANTLVNPTSVYSDGTRLFVADTWNNRVLIYNTIPTANAAAANVVIGQPNMTNNAANQNGSVNANTLSGPTSVYSDGRQLFVADHGNCRVLIYNTIPVANNTAADIVIGQPNMMSNIANNGGINANTLGSPNAVFSDKTRLFVADNGNHRVLIYYPPQLASILPNYGISGKTVQTTVFAAECGSSPTMTLVRNGFANISDTSMLQNNLFNFTYTLDLTHAAPSCYDVTVTASANPRSLKQTFTVLSPLQAPITWKCSDLGVTLSASNISGNACGLAIGDADQDNNQELYVANQDATLYQIKQGAYGWTSTSLPAQSGAIFNGVLLADGNGDQNWEVYGASANDSTYEFKTAAWQATGLPDPAGTGSLYGLAALDSDYDGIVEIYASRNDGHILQLKRSGSGSISDITPAGFAGGQGYGLASGDGNNDGTAKLYSANLDHKIYQYTINATWQAVALGTASNIMYSVAVGDGDNDGKNEVYGASKNGFVYLARYSSGWTMQSIGQPGNGPMYSVAVSDAENAGANQVYAACGDGHVYEYKYQSGNWTTFDLGSTGIPLYALAVGDADNDNHFEVYALGQNNHIYQFKAFSLATATPTPSPVIIATATVTITPTTTTPQSYFKIFHSQINPIHGEQARIRWIQPQAGPVSIKIYNLLGDKVADLSEGVSFSAGEYHEIDWNGKSQKGSVAGSGIYIVVFASPGNETRGKIAVIK